MTISGETHMNSILYALDGHCKTLSDLCEELNLSNRQISDGAAKLVIQGYAERISVGCFQLTTGGRKAVADGCTLTSGPNAPHAKAKAPKGATLRQRAWNAMRILQRFTLADLQMTAAREGDKNPENSLNKFCGQLVKAGYLRVNRKRVQGSKPTSNGFLKYQLVNCTGEIAPSYRANAAAIYDHNTGEEVSL